MLSFLLQQRLHSLHFSKWWYYYRHRETQVAFKNCVPFAKCMINNIIDGTTINDVENFDLVIPK